MSRTSYRKRESNQAAQTGPYNRSLRMGATDKKTSGEQMPHKASILIADDEPRVREILSRKLIKEGYNCVTADDGSRALKKLSAQPFDLALLDVMMPGKSGADVLKEIQNKYPDTAVIMVTAVSDPDTAIQLMRMGAFDYIIKPVDLDILMVSVERALERRNLMLENKGYQLHLEQKVEEQTEKVRSSVLNSIRALAYALEAKDQYTQGHSDRVTEIAMAIAAELAIPTRTAEKLRLAGLLHDIGKIGIRESVLNKQGKLTEEEYEHIKSHSEVGEHILQPIIEDGEILEMVRHHHERYDGKGYPDGLSAEQIPQGTMVLAVAEAYETTLSQGALTLAVSDAYDAMTSDRPYREAMSPEAALAVLEKGKGTQFDPIIVDALLRVVKKGVNL
jgi:putative two-component system response regulator